MKYQQIDELKKIVASSKKIVIIQADNPDGDSLASSLALEQILGEQGKQAVMYCSVDMPGYLKYLKGWDRVSRELPNQFDASIIVDASTTTLLEWLEKDSKLGWIASKPCIVLDHHGTTNNPITFAKVTINDPKVSSTGELIYAVSRQSGWPVDATSGAYIMTAILSDTQGLTNDLAKSNTYHVMAELVELGVNRPELEEQRRKLSKMSQTIYKYKAKLIERTEFEADGRLAIVVIPQHEINEYSSKYNPAPLIQGDMLQIEGVAVAVVFKQYDGGRITAAIRANLGFAVADKLAEHFDGGGHPYASGFKITSGKSIQEVRAECTKQLAMLLDNLEEKDTNATS